MRYLFHSGRRNAGLRKRLYLLSNFTSATHPLHQTTRQTLDSLRRPAATTFADNSTASQAWNALGQLTRVADPKGVATVYQRNAFGEVTSEISPDSGSVSYQRNAAGNIASMTDARGNTTSYQYDALQRVIQVSQADGKVQTFSYDGDSAQIGYLREFSDSSGSTGYQPDAFGRISIKTQFIADAPGVASNYTTRYAYSGAGELSQISYPSGLKIYYRRNASGQITGIDGQQPGADKPIAPFSAT